VIFNHVSPNKLVLSSIYQCYLHFAPFPPVYCGPAGRGIIRNFAQHLPG
jgi:hypothetical protein